MKSRCVIMIAVSAATLFTGGVCSKKLYPPEMTSLPSSAYAGDLVQVTLRASGTGYDSVRFVVNWDDGVVDTTVSYSLLDTANVAHDWKEVGIRQVRAAVYPLVDPEGIRWGVQSSIEVEAGGSHAPVVDSVFCPPYAVIGETTRFLIYATDPDGDSTRAVIAWGDSTDTMTVTPFLASPSIHSVFHIFARAETAMVVISAQDFQGALSLPDTILIPVGAAGGVGARRHVTRPNWLAASKYADAGVTDRQSEMR